MRDSACSRYSNYFLVGPLTDVQSKASVLHRRVILVIQGPEISLTRPGFFNFWRAVICCFVMPRRLTHRRPNSSLTDAPTIFSITPRRLIGASRHYDFGTLIRGIGKLAMRWPIGSLHNGIWKISMNQSYSIRLEFTCLRENVWLYDERWDTVLSRSRTRNSKFCQ